MSNTAVRVVCPHDGAINRVPPERLGDAPRCGGCHKPLFTGAPQALDSSGFDRHLQQGDLPVLADFWADWCGPCRMMAPAFHAAASLLEPQVRLVKVDTEAAPDLAARYGIRSIPTLILFAGGREAARHSGALMRPEQIAHWAQGALHA